MSERTPRAGGDDVVPGRPRLVDAKGKEIKADEVPIAQATAADLQAFNFPNPFDLSAKTKTLNHGGSTSTMDTTGTIIRYLVPSGKAGVATLEIYNVVGDKVRSISLGSPTADTYHYVSWDGKNDSGNNVASGVYIGMLKVGGSKKTWKMAVIK